MHVHVCVCSSAYEYKLICMCNSVSGRLDFLSICLLSLNIAAKIINDLPLLYVRYFFTYDKNSESYIHTFHDQII